MFFLYTLGFLFVSSVVGLFSFLFFQWVFWGCPYPSMMGGLYWWENGCKTFSPPNRIGRRFVSVTHQDQQGWLLKRKYRSMSLIFSSLIGVIGFIALCLEVM